MDDNFKYYPVPAEGLALLDSYQDRLFKMTEDQEALSVEYRAKLLAIQEAARTELHGMWVKLAEMTGIDAEASWDNREWQIEARYIKSGFGALIYYPAPANPLAALLNMPPDETDEGPDGSSIPKGALVH